MHVGVFLEAPVCLSCNNTPVKLYQNFLMTQKRQLKKILPSHPIRLEVLNCTCLVVVNWSIDCQKAFAQHGSSAHLQTTNNQSTSVNLAKWKAVTRSEWSGTNVKLFTLEWNVWLRRVLQACVLWLMKMNSTQKDFQCMYSVIRLEMSYGEGAWLRSWCVLFLKRLSL